MPNVELVKALKNDYPVFRDIRMEGMRPHVESVGLNWDQQHEETYHREMFDRGIENGTLYRVVGPNGLVIGFLSLTSVRYLAIWLHRDHRNKGFGTAAMERVLSWSTVTTMLDVFKTNPAQRLYERLGFKKFAENEHFNYMWKRLSRKMD